MAESPRAADLAGATLLSDSELVAMAREGDRRAFGTLYLRHHDAAWRVACAASGGGADAEDAVAEGFTKVFAALPRIVDRDLAFRPYLLACVRNTAMDLHRRDRRIDLRDELPDHLPVDEEPDDVILADLERNLVGEALKSLPERWRTVLWLTEVEGMTPTEVSAVIGIKPNAVAALSYRAREGLREAYLQAHLRAEAPAECRYTVDRLGPYVRQELADRERIRVQTHLDGCAHCRHRRDELADVNASLLGSLVPVPLVLGSRAQQEWLAGGRRGKGARRTRTPARAAVVASRDTAAITQRALAMVVALLLLVGGGSMFNRFGSDESSRLDRVALPTPPLGAAPEVVPGPTTPEAPLTDPASVPTPSRVRSSSRPPAMRSTPRSLPTLAIPAPLPTETAPVAPAPTPQVAPAPAPAPTQQPAPPPPPTETPTPPAPPPAAAAKASIGRGPTGVVVGAGIADDGSPSEPDVTAGGQTISGDEPPPSGPPGVEGGGSAVPAPASDAVGQASDAVEAVDGALPVDTPAPETPAGDTPAVDAPAVDTPAPGAPASGAPAEGAPAASPAMNAPAVDGTPVQGEAQVERRGGTMGAVEDMWGWDVNPGPPTASPAAAGKATVAEPLPSGSATTGSSAPVPSTPTPGN